MTNVLVPTDFTPASLKMAEGFLKNNNDTRCTLVLFHAFEMPSSPFDMLASSYKDPSYELMNEPFRQACKQLKDEYTKQVAKIIVRCMTGNTRALFRNFVEANDIDLIYCPQSFLFKPAHPRSVDPLYLFKKCDVPVVKTNIQKPDAVFANGMFGSMQMLPQ